jgi:HD-GYP domain-containing protein (c-di-GMP phosphodiesterase class II)
MPSAGAADAVRLSELMAAWSLGIDVAMSAPMETGLGICVVATRLAALAGADEDTQRRTYYLALLRHIGCTAGNQEFAAMVGDERAFRAGMRGIDPSAARELMPYLLRTVVGSQPLGRRPLALLRLLRDAPGMKQGGLAICEVAQMLARRLDLGAGLERDLVLVYERYDGKGFPANVKAADITLPAQCVHLAEAAVTHLGLGGPDAAVAVVRARSGKAFDPALADVFLGAAAELCAEPAESRWDDAIAAEPGRVVALSGDALDEACRAIADFVDLKSRYTVGHSSDVARLASAAASSCGLPRASVDAVRRAGWLHDLGRLSVSVLVWDKAGALNREEWEQVRLHAYYTERVLARPASLGRIGALAALHHERCDGSGYHRAQAGGALATEARLLAAADVYAALVADRPHRPALAPPDAANALRAEVSAGRLDAAAVDAVLDAAGHRVGRRAANVAGLTAREVEVLRLLAHGSSNREIAQRLVVSPRTVEHHVESVYTKAGVRTRAAATVFALQHGLVSGLET